MDILSIENLGKSYTLHHQQKIIKASHGISFKVQAGEFVGITGKSGSGKSTILKCIYRTNFPDQGHIFYDSLKFGHVDLMALGEREMLYLRKFEIGYVSQFLNVMPRTTAFEIVQWAVQEMGHSADTARQKATDILQHFELDPNLWDSFPQTFSGGEKLRLNIARAMVKHPRLLLLDEPTASLDHESKLKVRDLIEKLKAEGTTMIGIFHDIEFMEQLCDQRIRIAMGTVA